MEKQPRLGYDMADGYWFDRSKPQRLSEQPQTYQECDPIAMVVELEESYALLARASEETEISERFLAQQVDAAIAALRLISAGDPTPKTTAGNAVKHILKGEFGIRPAVVHAMESTPGEKETQ